MNVAAAGSSLELVVVRTPNWLGDTVMALPMLAALRAARPDTRITLIGRWATLLAGQGVADALLPYPNAQADRRHLASAIAHERPDVAILLPGSFESAFAAWRWGARRCIAYATDGRGFFLTDALPLPSPRRHQVDEYAALLAPLGIADGASVPQWTLAKSAAADAEVDGLLAATGLDGGGPLIGLHLGAAFGSSKLWPAESYGRLARFLIDDGLRPVLLGTSDDVATAAAVARASRRSSAAIGWRSCRGCWRGSAVW
jgi:heptosyltransferase-2